MKNIYIFLFIYTLFLNTTAYAFEKGNSAWMYGKNDTWVEQIQDYNRHASSDHQFKYLFPETGTIHIDSTHDKLLITYDQTVTAFYKKKSKYIKILPDISFWVANTNFKNWSKKQYQQTADLIAMYINQDPNADGVFLDLEFYKPSFLSFYQELVKKLNEHNKILSVIVRPGQENIDWFKILGKNAFVVLYGYDLHESSDSILPISPDKYENRLKIAIDNFTYITNRTRTSFMIGTPLIATTYEWEQKKTKTSNEKNYLKNNYRQIDYFKSAKKIYNKIRTPLYLGISIWAFVDPAKKNIYYPLKITSEEWRILDK